MTKMWGIEFVVVIENDFSRFCKYLGRLPEGGGVDTYDIYHIMVFSVLGGGKKSLKFIASNFELNFDTHKQP